MTPTDAEIVQLAAAMCEREPSLLPETARELAELALRARATSPRLMGVQEVAVMCGVSTKWVYRNAAALGAIPLGDGPKARLRFRPSDVEAAISAMRRRPSRSAPERRTGTSRRARKRGEGITRRGAPLIPYADAA